MSPPQSPVWFIFPRPNPRAALRLFCFPYAGGGSTIFRTWPENLPSTVEVCAVELPGRGSRLRQSCFDRLLPLVGAIGDAMPPYLDKPFALFGHSMGALISFELARHMREAIGINPSHLVVSGRRAPQMSDPDPPLHNLSESDLMEELHRLNGTPAEVLQSRELMSLLLPTLRADFAVCETYQYSAQPPLECPITAFGGLQDSRGARADLEAWREQTCGSIAVHMLPGDHFFLHTAQSLFLRTLSQVLNQFGGKAV